MESQYDELAPLLRTTTIRSNRNQFARTLAPFMLLQASLGLGASLQATFYPLEAELKGATASQFGPVFGVIHLSLFLCGPLVGKFLPVLGVRTILPLGILIDGGSFLLFGLLQWVDNLASFLALSYIIRLVEGVGAAATWTSNLSVLMSRFPDRKASVKAWCDASFNLGLTVGPVAGAVLYDYGGFCLPFLVTAGCMLASGAAVCCTVNLAQSGQTGPACSLPLLSTLARPPVLLSLLTATTAAYTIGTVEATLAPHLHQLGLHLHTIALAFLVMSVCSVAATPAWGWLCDGKLQLSPWLASAAGCLLTLICFTTLGPAPYLVSYLSPSITSTCLSLALQGAGTASLLVASFASAQQSGGTGDQASLVSGLFTAAFAAGNFAGPSVSGVLYDLVGFRYNCLVLQGVLLLVLLLNLGCHCRLGRARGQARPSTPDIIAKHRRSYTDQQEDSQTRRV